MFNVGEFIESAKRIFIISRKPTWKDYQTMVKITGLGILVIALLGFVIIFVFRLFSLGS